MNKLGIRLIILSITLTIVAGLNSLLLVGESQNVEKSELFLTYNDTAYGISINYPSNWEIYDDSKFLLSILENISSSEQAGTNQNNEVTSKVSNVLEAFGLKEVSDLLGLKPDERSEFFQKMSQALNEGTVHMILAIVSPLENESDVFSENMNLVVENISAISPIPLTDYVNANIEGMKIGLDRFQLVEPMKEITVDGQQAISFVYTGTIGTENQKSLVAYMIRGNTGYILHFGALPQTYSMYAETFEKMLQSFRISN
jgi:hypothetical protein